MEENQPPDAFFGDIDLPGTRLHYLKTGSGSPLIIVPATVSLIRQWMPLAQFMGQRYTAYFFELPGHGGSTPYPGKFDSRLVPGTVEAFVNALGIERFTLMGFSFGGLLALRTLERLQHRIDKVLLMSPFVSHRALKYDRVRRWAMKSAAQVLHNPTIQHSAHRIMTAPQAEAPLIYALSKVSNVNENILRSKDALKIPLSTLDVLSYTIQEIFTSEYHYACGQFDLPCYFGMSVYDDLLDYDLTISKVRTLFPKITTQQFTLPYHQPPEPPTFTWLNKEFGCFLDMIQ